MKIAGRNPFMTRFHPKFTYHITPAINHPAGQAVMAEAGLDGESQYRRIVDYLGLRVATV